MGKKVLTLEEVSRKGGQARMNGMSKEERKQLAKKAAAARWNPQSANGTKSEEEAKAE